MLWTQLGREPTVAEIAEEANLPVDAGARGRDAARTSTSLDQPVGEQEDAVFGDLVAGDGPATEEEVEQSRCATRRSSGRSPRSARRERDVIVLRYGLCGREPKTLERSAARSASRASACARSRSQALERLGRLQGNGESGRRLGARPTRPAPAAGAPQVPHRAPTRRTGVWHLALAAPRRARRRSPGAAGRVQLWPSEATTEMTLRSSSCQASRSIAGPWWPIIDVAFTCSAQPRSAKPTATCASGRDGLRPLRMRDHRRAARRARCASRPSPGLRRRR